MEDSNKISDKVTYQLLSSQQGAISSGMLKQSPIDIKIEPEGSDYDSEFIRRYFAKKANEKNGNIYEISVAQYEELYTNPFYEVTKIGWKIAGPLRSVYENGIKVKEGVIDYNEIAFKKLRKTIPNIGSKIRSLTEYYKS
tara:strand:+ start:16 stop:435 length:420 start_codon:yes stop_codon:yes gene_type:complete